MRQAYLGIVFLMAAGVLNAVLMMLVSHWASPSRPTAVKSGAYESGMVPLGDARHRFSVKFYLVAMLFIVFDIETVFFFPWAVIYRSLGLFGLVEMVAFIFVLAVGLAYAWKKGALEWD